MNRTQRFTDHAITEAMIVFGGGFVSGLGHLFRMADPDNQARLKRAFKKYWIEYDDPIMQERLEWEP